MEFSYPDHHVLSGRVADFSLVAVPSSSSVRFRESHLSALFRSAKVTGPGTSLPLSGSGYRAWYRPLGNLRIAPQPRRELAMLLIAPRHYSIPSGTYLARQAMNGTSQQVRATRTNSS